MIGTAIYIGIASAGVVIASPKDSGLIASIPCCTTALK